ncbi:hypothetical protein KEJ21_01495 [Candidatus Bathyarchaeota archaeon]|nr:hypothetical protein [Candidatus Bathyarchaeota archaeon]MBS7630710.1 hypothetical protein [Candidatus Bathyarchaeota archaeon]
MKKTLSINEFKGLIREEADKRILEWLFFLRIFYNGDRVIEAAEGSEGARHTNSNG